MKRFLTCLLLLFAFNVNAQDLNLRINLFYDVISNTSLIETAYKLRVDDFISPSTKLNRDSIGGDYFSYWDAQFNVNNKFKKTEILTTEFNNDSTIATVFVNQYWLLDGLGDYVYQMKSEWVKYNNTWYLSDKPSKIISIQPYYEDNQK
ncbi:MAG: hypothetical protein ACK44N_11105 [Bacteroidota bacterium]|jgi:hypothetical protein